MNDNSKTLVFIIALVVCAISYFLFKPETFDANFVGYYYPFGAGDIWYESDGHASLEECIEWIDDQHDLAVSIITSEYLLDEDYECMKNCNYGDKFNQGTKFTCREDAYY